MKPAMKPLLAPLCALALAACASAPPSLPEAGSAPRGIDSQLAEATVAPLTDLNIVRAEIPKALAAARAAPYAMPADMSCPGLAADIQAYRRTYNIPDSETDLAPKDHQARPVVQELTARATALHKHSALTNQPGASAQNRQGKANRAEDAARPNIEPTQAEALMAKLRVARQRMDRASAPIPRKAESAKEAGAEVQKRRQQEDARRAQQGPERRGPHL